MDQQLVEEIKTGIKVIDQQHQVIIDVLDELQQANVEGQLAGHLGPILGKLQGYTQYHFATEEMYFAQFDFEGAEEHIAAHRWAVAKVEGLIEDFQDDGVKMAAELALFLSKWIVEHVRDMDRKYVDCFKKHGLK